MARLPRRARDGPLRPGARRGSCDDGQNRLGRQRVRRPRHRMRRRGGLPRRRRGDRRRDGVDRRGKPRTAAAPASCARRADASGAGIRNTSWCSDGSGGGDPRGRDHPPRRLEDRARPLARRGRPLEGGRDPRLRREQRAAAREIDRKKTLVKAMDAGFGTDPPPASPKLAADARQRPFRWAPPGVEPARRLRRRVRRPAAELPASMNG